MRPGTIVVIVFSAALFFIVRQFLIKWGLVDRSKSSMNRGDFGMQTLFAWGAYFVLWVCPSWVVWGMWYAVRKMGWVNP